MLTIDIGNSRIKWAVWNDARITLTGACEYSRQELKQAFGFLNELPPQQDIIVACVAVMLLVSWVERNPRRKNSTTKAADSEPSAPEKWEQRTRDDDQGS